MNGHPLGDIEAYLDGNLPSGRMREVGEHLAGCAHCRNELTRAKRLRDRLSTHLSAIAPTRVPAPRAAPARRSAWSLPAVRWAAAVAGVLLVAAVYEMASPGIMQADPGKLIARVPDAGGRELTIYSNGAVYAGSDKLPQELAAPVRQAFRAQASTAGPRPNPSPIRVLEPKPEEAAVMQSPRELAWSGPTSAPYTVALERRVGGDWQAAPGFPRTVSAFSTDLPSMEPGMQYRWQVSTAGRSTGWVGIRVLSNGDRDRLASVGREFGEQSAVYGSLCASLGLLTRAEAAFATQAARYPQSPEYAKALEAVRARMGQ